MFRLRVSTGFPDVDFPLNSVSPSKHATKDGAWNGEWNFESLSGAGAPDAVR